ncbi:MAG: hypothetical protein JEZ14_22865 [Marinilabiliaceae bacterium]|nr:hypothetical protein [Marinilabiliaceae bacterium]
MHLSVIPASKSDNDKIVNVEIYAFFEEQEDTKVYSHGSKMGKLYKTFAEETNFNQIDFNVTVDEVYELYKDDLKIKNRSSKLKAGDRIELRWVITDASGNVTDTRMDCQGRHCQHLISVKEGVACPYDISGTINYQVLEVGSGSTASVGQTGSVIIKKLSMKGDFTVNDAEFGGSWDGSKVFGEIKGSDDGQLSITNDHDNAWEFLTFDGSVCTLKWKNKWTDSYGEWAVVKLTRADGADWPDYLYGEGQ